MADDLNIAIDKLLCQIYKLYGNKYSKELKDLRYLLISISREEDYESYQKLSEKIKVYCEYYRKNERKEKVVNKYLDDCLAEVSEGYPNVREDLKFIISSMRRSSTYLSEVKELEPNFVFNFKKDLFDICRKYYESDKKIDDIVYDLLFGSNRFSIKDSIPFKLREQLTEVDLEDITQDVTVKFFSKDLVSQFENYSLFEIRKSIKKIAGRVTMNFIKKKKRREKVVCTSVLDTLCSRDQRVYSDCQEEKEILIGSLKKNPEKKYFEIYCMLINQWTKGAMAIEIGICEETLNKRIEYVKKQIERIYREAEE